MNISNLNVVNNKIVKYCSLCKNQGHNKRTCNISLNRTTTSYINFETICATQVMRINTIDEFKNWLIENYYDDQELLRGFTYKKIRYTTSEPIDAITEYIFNTYKDSSIQLTNPDIEHYDEPIQMGGILFSYIMNLLSMNQEENITENRDLLLSIENNNESINKYIECSICLDEKKIKSFVKFDCNHEFCKDCVIQTIQICKSNNLCCALCRSNVKSIITREKKVYKELYEISNYNL
jgi:hypothetical protein